jgi:hypothetical protein
MACTIHQPNPESKLVLFDVLGSDKDFVRICEYEGVLVKETIEFNRCTLYILDVTQEQVAGFECIASAPGAMIWMHYGAGGIAFAPGVTNDDVKKHLPAQFTSKLEEYHGREYPKCYLAKKNLLYSITELVEGCKIYFVENAPSEDPLQLETDPEFEVVVEWPAPQKTLMWLTVKYDGLFSVGPFETMPHRDKIQEFLFKRHMELDQKYHLDRLRKKLPGCDPRWEKDQSSHPDPDIKALTSEDYRLYLAGNFNPFK